MLTSIPSRVVSGYFAACILVSAATACTLSDYGYLGAQRDAATAAGGSDGGFTSLPANGGTLSRVTDGSSGGTGGITGTNTARTSFGGSAAGAASSVAMGGTGATPIQTGGSTEITTATSTTGGQIAASGGTSPSATGGAPVDGGSVATGGLTSASSTSAQTNAGTTSAAGASATGGIAGAGGVSLSEGGTVNATSYSTIAGGTSAGGASATGGSITTGGTTASINSSTGLPTSCSGCAVLSVPFNAKGQVARFLMLYTPMVSVSSASILRVRAFAQQLGNTQYQLFVQQDSGSYTICFSGQLNFPSGIANSWVTLDFSLASCNANTNIGRLGLELIADTAPTAPTPSSTQLWIDSIWIETDGYSTAGPFNFDASSTVNANSISYDYNQSYGTLYLRPSNPTPPTGSTLWWRNG